MSDQISQAEQERIQNEMSKKFQKEYELYFTAKESTWKQVETLGSTPEKPGSSRNGIFKVFIGSERHIIQKYS